jgi:outer membrane protein
MNQISQKQIYCILLGLMMAFLSLDQCYAKDDSKLERAWDFGLGLGYGNSSNPFVGADDIPSYLSLDVALYGKRFFFDNGELGFTLINKPNFGLNLITTYNSERIYYSYLNDLGLSVFSNGNGFSLASSSPIVELNENTVVTIPQPQPPSPLPPGVIPFPTGSQILPFSIPNRRISFNLGFELIYDTPIGSVGYQLAQNINNTHSGADMILDFTKTWKKNRWGISSTIAAHWKSAELVDYYYGVGEVAGSLLDINYHPGSSTDISVNLTANYRLTNHLSLVTSLKFSQFGSSIRNSPIIDESSKHIIFTGLYYRF